MSDNKLDDVREKWNTAMLPLLPKPPKPPHVTNGYTLWLKRQEEKQKMPLFKRIVAEIKDWFEV